jgi:AraC family transcriptional regulator
VSKRNEAEELSSIVLESLDNPKAAADLARDAYRSRSSFFRLFRALIEETPAAFRRRILLERAAWQLTATRISVTDIALDANYGSLEAFTRAFRKAFQVSPSLYRRTASGRIHLPTANEFHFRPPDSQPKGAKTDMDLFDLFAGTDAWYSQRLLQHAASLSDEQLDRPTNSSSKMYGWDKPDKNLREILERMVQIKEIWTMALTGAEMPPHDRPAEDRTPAALLRRFEKADKEFQRILRDIRDRGAWDQTFVDALCEPPETFTYGGMFAHIITFNTYRRIAALDSFHRLGVKLQGDGDPIEYERRVSGVVDTR